MTFDVQFKASLRVGAEIYFYFYFLRTFAPKGSHVRVYLGVRTCELFLCFVAIFKVRVIMLTSLFSLFYVTREFYTFLHRGRAPRTDFDCS